MLTLVYQSSVGTQDTKRELGLTATDDAGRNNVVMKANAFMAVLSRLLEAVIFALSLLSIWEMMLYS